MIYVLEEMVLGTFVNGELQGVSLKKERDQFWHVQQLWNTCPRES
jgi:hypothetical protein